MKFIIRHTGIFIIVTYFYQYGNIFAKKCNKMSYIEVFILILSQKIKQDSYGLMCRALSECLIILWR